MIHVQHLARSSLAGTRQTLSATRVRFGRRPECEVRFDAQQDTAVSGTHFEASVEGTRILLRDLGSTNGTFVNGVRISGAVELRAEDVVRLGANGPELRIAFEPELAATAAATATANAPVAPAKKTVGVETLERAISNAALTERTKSRRTLFTVVALLVVAGAALVVLQQQRQAALHEAVDANRREVDATRQTAEEARQLAQAASAEFERSLKGALQRHEAELADLKGQLGNGESEVARLIVEIEERNRALEELTAGAKPDQALLEGLEQRVRELSSELEQQEEQLREQAGQAAPDWATLVDRYKQSLFLCLAQSKQDEHGNFSQSIGTAWVCRADGILATNAHVAEFMRDPTQWELLKCVQNDTGKLFDVREVLLDTRYDETPQSPDVALIRIDTQGEELVALPLASDDELGALRIGTQLGTMGYPGELMWEYTGIQEDTGELLQAQATFKDGWIGRILDFQSKRASFATSHWIQHSASLSGGTSGSPMFTRDGKVVALNNSGKTLFVKTNGQGASETERMANPAEIGFAIRVDLLRELLDGSGW